MPQIRDNILVKVFGQLYPMPDAALEAGLSELSPLLGEENAAAALELDGETLLLNYEGVYFPLDDFLAALEPHFGPGTAGKIDFIDLEAWEICRLRFKNGKAAPFSVERRSLNHVLEYAGF